MKPLPYLFFSLILLFAAACSGGADTAHPHGEEDHGHGHGHEGESMEVELTRTQMETVGIVLGHLEKREMADVLSVSGTLEVGPRDEAFASAPLAGTVTRLCVSPGQNVKAGQTVAWVDAPEVALLRQQLAEAGQAVAAARQEADRQEALASRGAGVRKNLDAARNDLSMAEIREQGCRAALSRVGAGEGSGATLRVTAPISGTVVAVDAVIGGFADMQMPIARIVDNSGIFCRLQVLEKDVAMLAPGMKVEMRLTNDPSYSFSGTVTDINPALDPATRTIPVKASLSSGSTVGAERKAVLIPGMAVSARVFAEGAPVDALPEAAVVHSGGKSYIFVLEEEDGEDHEEGEASHEAPGHYHFRKIEVATGQTSFGYTAVTPLVQLPADASVVTEGAFYLNSMSSDHGEHSH